MFLIYHEKSRKFWIWVVDFGQKPPQPAQLRLEMRGRTHVHTASPSGSLIPKAKGEMAGVLLESVTAMAKPPLLSLTLSPSVAKLTDDNRTRSSKASHDVLRLDARERRVPRAPVCMKRRECRMEESQDAPVMSLSSLDESLRMFTGRS
jgi:hypothetical protein